MTAILEKTHCSKCGNALESWEDGICDTCKVWMQIPRDIGFGSSGEIRNNFESKCSYKIETNSKGHNTSIHVYQGCTEQEMKDTIDMAIKGHNYGQEKLGGNKTE